MAVEGNWCYATENDSSNVLMDRICKLLKEDRSFLCCGCGLTSEMLHSLNEVSWRCHEPTEQYIPGYPASILRQITRNDNFISPFIRATPNIYTFLRRFAFSFVIHLHTARGASTDLFIHSQWSRADTKLVIWRYYRVYDLGACFMFIPIGCF